MKISFFLPLLSLLSLPAFAGEITFEKGAEYDDSSKIFKASWNECTDPTIPGNYMGMPCLSRRKMDKEFQSYLKDHIYACANEGLAKVGGGKADKIYLIHDGVAADSRHSHHSMHAVGRAIDIQIMKVTLEDGDKRAFDFKITSKKPGSDDRKFYEGFRTCWGQLMKMRSCPPRETDSPVGTIGWEDSRHRDHHLHTSLPFCPNSRGYMITGFEGDDVNEDSDDAFPYSGVDMGQDI